MPIFAHSKHMIDATKIKMYHATVTIPITAMICHPLAVFNFNLCAKFIFFCLTRETEKTMQKDSSGFGGLEVT